MSAKTYAKNYTISPDTVSSLFEDKRVYMHNPVEETKIDEAHILHTYSSGKSRFINSYDAPGGIKDNMTMALKDTYQVLIQEVITRSLEPYNRRLKSNEKDFIAYTLSNSTSQELRNLEDSSYEVQRTQILKAYNYVLYGTTYSGGLGNGKGKTNLTDLGKIMRVKLLLHNLRSNTTEKQDKKDALEGIDNHTYSFKNPNTGKTVNVTSANAINQMNKMLADAFESSKEMAEAKLEILKKEVIAEGITKKQLKKIDKESTLLMKQYKSYQDVFNIYSNVYAKVFEDAAKSNAPKAFKKALQIALKQFNATGQQKIGFAMETAVHDELEKSGLGGKVNLIGKDLSQRGDISYEFATEVEREAMREFNFEVKSNVNQNFTKLINNDRGNSRATTNNSLGELMRSYTKFSAKSQMQAKKGFSYASYVLGNIVNSGTMSKTNWYDQSRPSILAIRGLWIIAFLLNAFEGTEALATTKQAISQHKALEEIVIDEDGTIHIEFDKSNAIKYSNKVLVIMGNQVYYLSDIIEGIIKELKKIMGFSSGLRMGTGIAGLLTSSTSYYNASWFIKSKNQLFGDKEYSEKQVWMNTQRKKHLSGIQGDSNFYNSVGEEVQGFKTSYKRLMQMRFKVLYGIKLNELNIGG